MQNNEKEEKYMYIKILIHSDLTLNEHRNLQQRTHQPENIWNILNLLPNEYRILFNV